MDTRGSASFRSKSVFRRFSMSLSLAVLEWFLILMLFIDASFSYLVTKFARCCGLQVPCLLCSRLDHVLGNVKSKFYWDLICGHHKSEISSLVLCHVHNKLVDVHETCENCLFSFATINKSNSETYRLLVGKMGDDPRFAYDHNEVTRICSCCNTQWVPKGYAQNLFHDEVDAPLLEAVEHNKDDIKKIKNEKYVSLGDSDIEKTDFDRHSHIEYKKVKINSDTESEVPFSDDGKEDIGVNCESFGREIATSSVQREIVVPVEIITNVDIRHGLEELNWQKVEHKADISPTSDFISFEEVSPPAHVAETSVIVVEEKDDGKEDFGVHCESFGREIASSSVQREIVVPVEIITNVDIRHGLEELKWQKVEHKADISPPSDFISFEEVSPPANVAETSVVVVQEKVNAPDTSQVEKNPVIETETQVVIKTITNETYNFQMPNYLELGDAYKLAIGNKGRQLSGKFSEQRALQDAAKVSEDLKVLLTQISFTRGIELNAISPRLSGNIEEYKNSDSSSFGMQLLQRRISLERNESILSYDGSTISEIEGESVVDRLKRQVEHDRKLMDALYRELEEERNASADATNQAMAMITRLQEEKAALNMEALQCLRVMEEQAEHDDEELQKANELLANREREMGDLVADLELYKWKFGEIPIMDLEGVDDENILLKKEKKFQELEADRELCKTQIEEMTMVDDENQELETDNRIDERALSFGNKNIKSEKGLVLDFEDERLYILDGLKKMEKKLHLFSNNGVYLETDGTEEDDLQKNYTMYKEDTDTSTLRKELFDLSNRLERLEADRNFLEHSINSLRSGNEGIKFIEEIACHLRELHRIGIRRD